MTGSVMTGPGSGRRVVMLVVIILLLFSVASIFCYKHKEKSYAGLQSRLQDARDEVAILDDYSARFSELFPVHAGERWIPDDFPLIDWKDRVINWLSSAPGVRSVYRWGERVALNTQEPASFFVVQYPLWVDAHMPHETPFLQWLETAWQINPTGFENRGCQIWRSESGDGLTAQCLFALSTYSINDDVPAFMEKFQ